ncbi:hypothetical protein B0H13DRAFT_774118 [Mycena leptocephala]|nr:hypothetical protein B0H13DRAFT_774118 [Mycena leptocephala]
MKQANQKTTSIVQTHTNRDESAAANLWAVYISEAEKYDKALVESWRSDMYGLLIFAGLFSASLTAFLIESYKTLSPDVGQTQVLILTQISQQLAGTTNVASAMNFSAQFIPPPSAVACNTLWFISLGFSLSCALIATLVEQWSRDFIQQTEMRPSPIIRARIFAYLYYGLQRFGMHTVVALIPLLLHISLILFFAGLVAFLYPVNATMLTLVAAMLAIVSMVYSWLTIIPIFCSDSPYRTPLTGVIWQLSQSFRALITPFSRWRSSDNDQDADDNKFQALRHRNTMVERMAREATQISSRRDERDGRALVWTVRSLADDNELEPFVLALPDVIWGPNGRRRLNDQQIQVLLDHSDIRLVPRIEGLLRTCDAGLLPSDIEARRRISCLKALWATAYLSIADGLTHPSFNLRLLEIHLGVTRPEFKHYLITTYSCVRWAGFRALLNLVDDVRTKLVNCRDNTPSSKLPDL